LQKKNCRRKGEIHNPSLQGNVNETVPGETQKKKMGVQPVEKKKPEKEGNEESPSPTSPKGSAINE